MNILTIYFFNRKLSITLFYRIFEIIDEF